MKTLFLLLCLFGTIFAIQDEYGVGQRKFKVSDKVFLERERDLIRLLQPEEHQVAASTYSIENLDAYSNPSAVKQFLSLHKQKKLLQGEAFSLFDSAHLAQAITLFKVFYSARDFDILYQTAVWVRDKVNPGMFAYSFSTALVHRTDNFSYILPPIYEIYPFDFFSAEDVERASKNSSYYVRVRRKHEFSYYLEDVGINAFYYYCNVYYPFWMDGEEFKLKNDRRGEQFYYLYQQLLARYYLERLSHGFGQIESFSYDKCCSSLNSSRLPDDYDHADTKVRDLERRFREAIDSGYAFAKNAEPVDLYAGDRTDLLGNMIEGNPDSLNPRYYGGWQIYARYLQGYQSAPTQRDPAFYQLYRRLVLLFQQYKQYLPPYSRSELDFPGVEIEEVSFDRLFTYFDFFDSEIVNFRAKMRQKRLNHKPFAFRVTVNSEKVADAVVRVYLGPKFDERGCPIELNVNRHSFVELDTFQYKLQVGNNVIERNSRQMYWYVPDRTASRTLYQKVVDAINNTGHFQLDSTEAFYGFPNRLLLPKGKPEGQVFQIYVIINPYRAPLRKVVQQDYYFHRVGTGMNYIDDHAFGFPFDRVIASSEFVVPNARFQDVVVYHKDVEDLNSQDSDGDL